jgi:hypothetical protein
MVQGLPIVPNRNHVAVASSYGAQYCPLVIKETRICVKRDMRCDFLQVVVLDAYAGTVDPVAAPRESELFQIVLTAYRSTFNP